MKNEVKIIEAITNEDFDLLKSCFSGIINAEFRENFYIHIVNSTQKFFINVMCYIYDEHKHFATSIEENMIHFCFENQNNNKIGYLITKHNVKLKKSDKKYLTSIILASNFQLFKIFIKKDIYDVEDTIASSSLLASDLFFDYLITQPKVINFNFSNEFLESRILGIENIKKLKKIIKNRDKVKAF